MNEQLWFLNTLVTMHVPHGHGGDGLSVIESQAPRGDSPPLHIHREDEIFHLLEGEMLIRIGDADRHLRAGQTLLAPAGTPHSYRVESDAARWLINTARGDFENMVRSVSRPAARNELPDPAGPPTPEAQTALAAECGRHGIELVGPPLIQA